jgi:regulator of RNase E activity RraA
MSRLALIFFAIDGKMLRHSFDRSLGKTAIHMASAWASVNRLVLDQLKVDENSKTTGETLMSVQLTEAEIEILKIIDTPTICNAIETFKVRGRVEGFLGMDLHCLFPELGAMLGYALTVTVDSTTPEVSQDVNIWQEWVLAMAAAPKPTVLVFQDIGPQSRKSAHMGEVMATLASRLGVIGLVTDGGVRDIPEVQRLGFHYFAAGVVSSHGNPRLLEVNVPVTIDGVRIEPGDLIHGDINGVTTIPLSIAGQVTEAALRIRAAEAELLDYIKGPDFSVDGYFKLRFKY